MPRFILLRIQTEPAKEPLVPDEIVVKFFPVKDALGRPVILSAEDPAEAFRTLEHPFLRHFFALELESTYNATIARLAAYAAAHPRPPSRRNPPSTKRLAENAES